MDAGPQDDLEVATLNEVVARLEQRTEEQRWRILWFLVDRYVSPRAGEAVMRVLVMPKE